MQKADEEAERAASLTDINEYIKRRGVSLRCAILPDKGRVLFADKDYLPGDVILDEPPLKIVATPESDHEGYATITKWAKEECMELDPFWYWCALCSRWSEQDYHSLRSLIEGLEDGRFRTLAKLGFGELERLDIPKVEPSQFNSFKLFYSPLNRNGILAEAQAFSKLFMDVCHVDQLVEFLNSEAGADGRQQVVDAYMRFFDPTEIARCCQIWILNCFEHCEDPVSYSTYFLSTFVSHSCCPNTVWNVTDDGIYHLVTRQAIAKGEEITLSYITDDSLLSPSHERIKELKLTKNFVCQCRRCTQTDLSRGFRCEYCQTGTFFLPSGYPPAKSPVPPRPFKVFVDSLLHPYTTKFLSKVGTFQNVMADSGSYDEELSRTLPMAFLPGLPQPFIRLVNFSNPEQLAQQLCSETMEQYMNHLPALKCLVCKQLPSEDHLKMCLAAEKACQSQSAHRNAPEIATAYLSQHIYYNRLLAEAAAGASLNNDHEKASMLRDLVVELIGRMAPFAVASYAWAALEAFESWMVLKGMDQFFPLEAGSPPKKRAGCAASEAMLKGVVDDMGRWITLRESLDIQKMLFTEDGSYYGAALADVKKYVKAAENAIHSLIERNEIADSTVHINKLNRIKLMLGHNV